jgi:hypothetical protein
VSIDTTGSRTWAFIGVHVCPSGWRSCPRLTDSGQTDLPQHPTFTQINKPITQINKCHIYRLAFTLCRANKHLSSEQLSVHRFLHSPILTWHWTCGLIVDILGRYQLATWTANKERFLYMATTSDLTISERLRDALVDHTTNATCMAERSTMARTFWTITFTFLVCATSVVQADLKIDFNSTTQDDGPHNNAGFQAYDAGHEVAADFTTKDYSAFGTTVGLTPAWSNTSDNRVQQMIDRGASFDANWTGSDLDLVTDFLGIDTRTGNGGIGNWDGTVGTPTYLTLTLAGLPENTYHWMSFHHDTEHVHTDFAVWLSTDGGTSFSQLADGYMSDSTPGGNPDSALDGSAGPVADVAGMRAAGSIYETTFAADGSNDVVLRFAPYSGTYGDAVHNQIWGINGFEVSEVPEPSTVTLCLVGCLSLLLIFRSRVRRG